MIAIIIEFEVKPECLAAFEEKLCADARETLRDEGCLRMEVLKPRNAVNAGSTLTLSELWRDDAAIAAHRDKPGHSHAWQMPLIENKRVSIYEVVA